MDTCTKLNSIYCLQPIGENKYRVLNRYYSKFGSANPKEKEEADIVEIPNIEPMVSNTGFIHFYQSPLKYDEDWERYEKKVRSLGLEKYL